MPKKRLVPWGAPVWGPLGLGRASGPLFLNRPFAPGQPWPGVGFGVGQAPLQGRASGRRAPPYRVALPALGMATTLVWSGGFMMVDQPRQPVERIGFLREIIVSVVHALDARDRVAHDPFGDAAVHASARQ